MKRLKEILINSIEGISLAGLRFPITIISILAVASIIYSQIATQKTMPLIIEKLIFTLLVGIALGITVQLAIERFKKLSGKRVIVYILATLVLLGYFLILLPVPKLSIQITLRSLVAIFALVCIALWIPAYKTKVNFNLVALIHVKAFFTCFFYSVVLSVGSAAIIGAVDILLFQMNRDIYAYMMTTIWIVFTPVYYLALLPKFNSNIDKDQSMMEQSSIYPKFLDILISNIAIPLISIYTLVLVSYFLKIIFTNTWPSGQIGPMVLIYSIAGLFILVISGLLENRIVLFYRKLFPVVLIPVIIMQLISVGIRVNTYGVTQSRYYMLVFGIFFIIVGITLSLNKTKKNEWIALTAAIFAIISIVPPCDAFSVSRYSQIKRIETILEDEGMLVNGEIITKADALEYTKVETTSILYYLENSSSLDYINWLPEGFKVYNDLEKTFGFKPTFASNTSGVNRYFDLYLDEQQPLVTTGYDIMLNNFVGTHMMGKEVESFDFELHSKAYTLQVKNVSNDDIRVSIIDAQGRELIGTGLNTFAKELIDEEGETWKTLSPKEMSFEVINNGYKMKIIFRNIHYMTEKDTNLGLDYGLYVLFGTPK